MNFYKILLISVASCSALFPPLNLKAEGAISEPSCARKQFSKADYFDLLKNELQYRLHLKVHNEQWPSVYPGIYYISFQADYPNKIDSLDDARKLIVDSASLVLSFLNESNPGIIPYLIEHPFSPEKMFFIIEFVKNMEIDDPLVGVSYFRGKIRYHYEYERIKVPNESFEEAKAKVAEGNQKGI